MLFGRKKNKDDASFTSGAVRGSDRQTDSFYAGEDNSTSPTSITLHPNRSTFSTESVFRKPNPSAAGYARSNSLRGPECPRDTRSPHYSSISQPRLHINPMPFSPQKVPPGETVSASLDRRSMSPIKQRGVSSQSNAYVEPSGQRSFSSEGPFQPSKPPGDQPNAWVRSRRHGIRVNSPDRAGRDVNGSPNNLLAMINPSGNEEDSADSSARSSPTNFSVPSSNQEQSTVSSASRANTAADPRTSPVSTPIQTIQNDTDNRRGPSPLQPRDLTLRSKMNKASTNPYKYSPLHKASLSTGTDTSMTYRDLTFPLPRQGDESRTISFPLHHSRLTNACKEENGALEPSGLRPNRPRGNPNGVAISARGRLVKELEAARSVHLTPSPYAVDSSSAHAPPSQTQSEATKPLVLRANTKTSQIDKRFTTPVTPSPRLPPNQESMISHDASDREGEIGRQRAALQACTSNDQSIMHSSSSLPTPPTSSTTLSVIAGGSKSAERFPSELFRDLPSHFDDTIAEIINKQKNQDQRLAQLSGQVKTITDQLAEKDSAEARRWSHFERELRGLRWLILDNVTNHPTGARDSVEAILGAYSDVKENLCEGVTDEEKPVSVSKDILDSSKADARRKRFGLAIDMTHSLGSPPSAEKPLALSTSRSAGHNLLDSDTLARIKTIQHKARTSNLNSLNTLLVDDDDKRSTVKRV
ncbi:hypothetical protein BU17DRAFT_85685 [Hysterangium stoloniferum]|nr:hypothetical protein BU17DRAFT_85685 [Hysterangium stoloniferum]